MRIYFDASVIIAALLSSSGGSAKVLHSVKSRKIVGITSQTVVAEILEKTNKLGKSDTEIEEFITQSNLIVRKPISFDEVSQYRGLIDIDDAHLIAGATLTKCTHLVTLDKKHVLRSDVQERFLSLRLVSPKELIKEIFLK